MVTLWVVNASPVILLVQVEQLDLLQHLGACVVIPEAAVLEIQRKGPSDPAVHALAQATWLVSIDPGPIPANVAVFGLERGQFDFVVSNPPYVGEWEADTVEAQVRKFEPKQAVFGGQTGLEIIRDLIPQAHRALKPGGWLVLEIGHSSYEQVRAALKEWQEVRATKDLQGIRRVIAARR